MPTISPTNNTLMIHKIEDAKILLGMLNSEIAAECLVTERTVERWLAGDRKTPPWALKLLNIYWNRIAENGCNY